MRLQQSVLEMQLTPIPVMLRAVLDQLQDKDQARIFAQPVSIKEVPLVWSHSFYCSVTMPEYKLRPSLCDVILMYIEVILN